MADRFRISQVVNNLMGNAIKFSPQGGRIEARFYVQDGWLVFKLTDNGPGVMHSEKDKIFQKFHQSDLDRNAKKQGWGLGLSIAQEIIQAHGGVKSILQLYFPDSDTFFSFISSPCPITLFFSSYQVKPIIADSCSGCSIEFTLNGCSLPS